LVAEGEKKMCIHKRLLRVCGEDTVDVSSVWWCVRQIKDPETVGSNISRQIVEWLHLYCGDASQHLPHWWAHTRWCTTTDELCSTLYIGKGSVMEIIEELGDSKVCVQWVPWMLTHTHIWNKENNRHWSFVPVDPGGENFVLQVGMGDKTWVHDLEPEPNWCLMEWYHTTSPRKKKLKS
jgi:hypothetical protein